MKKNTNSRKISLIKNNIWKKSLKRRVKILSEKVNPIDPKEYEEELDLLFPLRNNTDGQIHITMEDEGKNIVKVTIDDSLYQKDILEELDKYKDVPMKGFRQISKKVNKLKKSQNVQKKLGSLTLMDFRYGAQVRDGLINTKYFMEAKNKAVELFPQLKDILAAPFNINKEKGCKFNIVFYDNKNNVDNTVQEFMMNNMKNNNKENSENNPSTENVETN